MVMGITLTASISGQGFNQQEPPVGGGKNP